MKSVYICAVLIAFGFFGGRAAQATESSSPAVEVPPPGDYQLVEIGANHKTWQREVYERLPSGKIISHMHKYVELQTGAAYRSDGKMISSSENIDIQSDG